MKIQLNDKRIIKDAITVWAQPGPEVDVVMDLKNLTFREGSISEMYTFHVIDHFFPEEAVQALKSWHKCLAPKAQVHCLADNFEYVARAFVGGDISIQLLNDVHNHPNQCTRDSVVALMEKGGFNIGEIVVWLEGAPQGMDKKHYELILSGKKI